MKDKYLKDMGLAEIKEEKEKVIFSSALETDTYFVEEIATHTTHMTRATDGGGIKYLVWNRLTGEVEEMDEFLVTKEDGSQIHHKPICDSLLETGTVQLPSGLEEYGSTGELIKDIREFLINYFELPPFYEKFMPYMILFYWVYQRFPFVPYIQFVGRTGTGKTTAMEAFGSICYKPIDASGAITMASIFRTASMWRGTLLLDEFSSSGDNYQEMISFLKSGVGNKAVLRVEGDKEREVVAYMIKCPKIFTSETPLSDAGLQSRTIVIKMEKNKRRIPLYRLIGYENKARELRNKLLLWRFRNIDKIDLTEIEYGFKELMFLDRRVQQVITPIYYFSDEQARLDIMDFAQEQQNETLRERQESLEGQIFSQIMEIYPIANNIKMITETINKDMGVQRQYTEKKIANIVRKVLGFDIKRMGHDNMSTIVLEKMEDKIEELCIYYGIDKDSKQKDSPPVAPDASVERVAITHDNNNDNIEEYIPPEML